MQEELKSEIRESQVVDLEKEAVNYATSFLVGAVILSLLLLAGLYGYTLVSKHTVTTLDTKIADVDKQLSTMKDLDAEMLAFSSAVQNIQNAINQKQKWSLFFRDLNSITPKDVAYFDFSVDDRNQAKISGTTNTYSSLARLLVALKGGKSFKSVTLDSANADQGKLKFSITLSVNPAILK